MPTLVLGNSASYDGATNNAAGIASVLGNVATASSGSLTLKKGVSFDNSTATLKIDALGEKLLGKGGETVSSNKQGPITLTAADAGLFGTKVTVNSGVYLWSDDTAEPALDIQLDNVEVVNNGYIIGKGGAGGGNAGGDAISIASGVTGVSITNNSGAYIAGGGGGGGRASYNGGGGGAGGGDGQNGNKNANQYAGPGGPGGAPGQAGSDGVNTNYGGNTRGRGGGAGGGGGAGSDIGGSNIGMGGGGGGGRILPGVGGAGGDKFNDSFGATHGGDGGSAGNVGGNEAGRNLLSAGGGGGWGAAGGTGGAGGGGAGGSAINDNGQSYTLTNSGTVYGAT